ncbi:MAG: YihY/virulence factor BrkB family protein [Steroidobacteraceae bacterium]
MKHWFADNASTTGAALAFYCAFSLAPLLVIVITLTGWIVGEASAYGFLSAQLDLLFGHSTAQVLMDAVRDSQHTEGRLATMVSVGTLLIGATTVLAALDEALERIWGGVPKTTSTAGNWVRTRVLSLAFILTLSFLLLVSLTVSTAIAGLRSWTAERYAPLVSAVGGADLLVSIGLTTSLFALIYRYMPARRLSWPLVFGGGLFTAVLFSAGKWAVGWYLARATQPTAFGAAASFAALLLWLYYTAQILLLGAEFTACLGGLRKEESAPAASGRRPSQLQTPARPADL